MLKETYGNILFNKEHRVSMMLADGCYEPTSSHLKCPCEDAEETEGGDTREGRRGRRTRDPEDSSTGRRREAEERSLRVRREGNECTELDIRSPLSRHLG